MFPTARMEASEYFEEDYYPLLREQFMDYRGPGFFAVSSPTPSSLYRQ
jgi:hypothetical protein